MRKINYIVVHCSATPEGRDYDAKDIDIWHKKRGWSGIGYHYVVKIDGTIEPGRAEHVPGAHVYGYNRNSIGICYIGGCDKNMKPKDTRTQEQKKSLLKTLKNLKKRYPNAKIRGHRDFFGVRKACPSFDAKNEYKDL